MQTLVKMQNNILIVKLIGELDHHSASSAAQTIEKEIYNKNPRNMIFDLSNLSFMDSSGIGMIIGRYKIIDALGGKVMIVCKNNHIGKIILMSGLKKLMNVYADINEALENF